MLSPDTVCKSVVVSPMANPLSSFPLPLLTNNCILVKKIDAPFPIFISLSQKNLCLVESTAAAPPKPTLSCATLFCKSVLKLDVKTGSPSALKVRASLDSQAGSFWVIASFGGLWKGPCPPKGVINKQYLKLIATLSSKYICLSSTGV